MKKYTYGNNINYNRKNRDEIIIDVTKYRNLFLEQEKITIGKIINSIYQEIINLTSSSKVASFIIPFILIITGFIFIYRQVFPEIQQVLIKNIGYLDQGNISPVSEEFINFNVFIGKAENLETLTKEALNTNILIPDNTSLSYQKTFYISIPSIGINKLPVSPNVDSTSESIYGPILEKTLAHFKSTGLPFSEVKNNIVIYGHSTSLNYNPGRNNPMLAFSFLPELKIGDEILLHIENNDYKFIVSRTRIVEPTDISIINGVKGRRTLTLFTCYPLGSNSNRFVVVARES